MIGETLGSPHQINSADAKSRAADKRRWQEIKMKKILYIWITLSILSFAGAMISLFNLLAAANLGYDTTAEGKAIINMWSYAFFGLMSFTFIFAGIATISMILKKKARKVN